MQGEDMTSKCGGARGGFSTEKRGEKKGGGGVPRYVPYDRNALPEAHEKKEKERKEKKGGGGGVFITLSTVL